VLLPVSVLLKTVVEGRLVNEQSHFLSVIVHSLARPSVTRVEDSAEIWRVDEASIGLDAVVNFNCLNETNVEL
jgi:hypothetical protein